MNPLPQNLLDQLFQRSVDKLEAFEALASRSPNDTDSITFVGEIEQLLRECIAAGRFLPPGSADRRMVSAIVDEWNSRLRRHEHRPRGLDRLVDFDPSAGVVLDAECPYPGLEPYHAQQKGSFFGRGGLAKAYADRLIESRIFLIVGGSGSGKSSLALAGIQPLLKDRFPGWIFADAFTPGAAPLMALSRSVAIKLGRAEAAAALAEDLLRNPTSAPTQLRTLCDGHPLMLLVDQFEELFTLCPDPAAQQTLAKVLLALSEPSTDQWACHTLLTLRTDHIGRFDSSDALRPLYRRLVDERNFEYLPALRFADIRRAIVEPAKAVGLRFIPAEIPDLLASETSGLANGLPLLQFALCRLWDTRPLDAEGRPLDIVKEEMVSALPDVQHALGRVGNSLFEELTETQKAICERMILELVVLDETFEEPLRRRRNQSELAAVLNQRFQAGERDIEEVETRLVDAGLLRCFGSGDEVQIEVTHEALLRHWEHIRRLVSGDETKKRLHALKQIGREATEWQAHASSNDHLKQQGQPLREALAYLADGWCADGKSPAYLEACRRREDEMSEQVRQLKQAERDAETAKTARLKFRNRVFGSAAVLGLVFIVAILLVRGSAENEQRNLEAMASLMDRLPALEALDATYTLAKRGGRDARFALAHALERMQDSWLLGPGDVSLKGTRDGAAFLQFDPRKKAMHVYLSDPSGKPTIPPVKIDLGDKFDTLAQAEVGPKIETGKYAGKHLAVLAYVPGPGKVSHRIESYLVDATSRTARKIDLRAEESSPLLLFDKLSAIRIHPDGSRAIFSGVKYAPAPSAMFSEIVELRLLDDQAEMASLAVVPDPAKDEICSAQVSNNCPEEKIITAVTYGYNDTQLITGRLNGSVYCHAKRIIVAPSTTGRLDVSPVRTIVGNKQLQLFATATEAGVVRVNDCSKKRQPPPLPVQAEDPSSLSLVALKPPSDVKEIPLLTYFDTDHQLRCFTNGPGDKGEWSPYLCNAAHPLAGAAISPDGWQFAVERSGVGVVRRYPSEGLFSAPDIRRIEARTAGGLALRWKKSGENDQADRPGKGDERPLELPQDGGIEASGEGRVVRIEARGRVVGATLSPKGKQLVWIELKSTKDQPVRQIRTMDFGAPTTDDWPKSQSSRALAVAINDTGHVAHVERASQPDDPSVIATLYLAQGGSDDLLLKLSANADGEAEPSCLTFSPNSSYLAMGTAGGRVYRVAIPGLTVEILPPNTGQTPIDQGTGGIPSRAAPVTACAVVDDGTVVAGYKDGAVRVFPREGDPRELTKRTVYRFPVAIRQVSIDQGRVAALGERQQNNCTSPGLPGQALTVWDLSLSEKERGTPVAISCFPNEPIADLGEWSERVDSATGDDCPRSRSRPGTVTDGQARRVGICLVGPMGSRWHECPGCAHVGDTRKKIHARLLEAAEANGADSTTDMEERYGIKLAPRWLDKFPNLWPLQNPPL
jgi:hypothetical protein